MNNQHISGEDYLALKMAESVTKALDPMKCTKRKNLTGIVIPLWNNINLTCLVVEIPVPPPQIRLLVEDIRYVFPRETCAPEHVSLYSSDMFPEHISLSVTVYCESQ